VTEGRYRPAWAEIDLSAVRRNAELLRRLSAPAALCAVVKADGYGHGAVHVARAAIEGGATSLAVALVEEGMELRQAGVTAPVLVLSEAPVDALDAAAGSGLSLTVASEAAVTPLAASARRLGIRVPVHVKVDTGMHRTGVRPGAATALVASVAAEPSLRLEGVFTHLAVADGATTEDRSFTRAQLDRFDKVLADLLVRPPVRHAANTAAAIDWPPARYDMVRCGIGVYGLAPAEVMAEGPAARLRPALSLKAQVVAVRELDAGERPSYGRLRPLPERSVVATVPLGYADGVRRGLFAGGACVLIGGRRRPLAGMVTMDQIVVDCGAGDAGEGRAVVPGDEVVLIGRQGDEEISAAEWANLLGTIGYEVLCGIGPRVRRTYTDGTASGPAGEPGRARA
jgi:alanine racemase